MKNNLPNLPKNILDYLNDLEDNYMSYYDKNMDIFVERVLKRTGLDPESAKIIIVTFFREVKNSLLKGCVVRFKDLGNLVISNNNGYPMFRVLPKFKKNLNNNK